MTKEEYMTPLFQISEFFAENNITVSTVSEGGDNDIDTIDWG